ncbi:hypothetical protein D1007_03647 [Hordeum vulgare]|nr:hypothetical protein D1007_03647 [Hordeum vulgare]
MVDNAALSITVESGQLAAAIKGRRWAESVVYTVGLATACMPVASAMYKAPAGVFGGHKCAYYVSVVSAGAVGLAEALEIFGVELNL